MNIIRKSVGTIVILGGLAGCAGDDGAPPETTPSSPGQLPSKTVTPPAAKIQPEGDKKVAPKTLSVDPDKPAGKKADDAPKLEPPGKADTSKPAGAAAKLTDEDLAGIKELPQAEQAAAIAQVVCPVSSENLGGMGKPFKVSAEGRTFYLCCKSCEKDLKADPKAVLAKLDKLKAGK